MQPLTKLQIEEELNQLDDWSFIENKIQRNLKFKDFKEALSFMVRVGFEAESQGHHPDWNNVYNSVTVSLNTHDADDKVTSKDIKLAKAIDKIFKTY